MDKWLWAARFYKTRSLAGHACELGRIESNGNPAKAAREVKPGDRIKVRNDAGEFTVEVLLLIEMRGPATVARTMYRETEESIKARAEAAEIRKSMPFYEAIFREGKPSKKERRDIDRLRGR